MVWAFRETAIFLKVCPASAILVYVEKITINKSLIHIHSHKGMKKSFDYIVYTHICGVVQLWWLPELCPLCASNHMEFGSLIDSMRTFFKTALTLTIYAPYHIQDTEINYLRKKKKKKWENRIKKGKTKEKKMMIYDLFDLSSAVNFVERRTSRVYESSFIIWIMFFPPPDSEIYEDRVILSL